MQDHFQSRAKTPKGRVCRYGLIVAGVLGLRSCSPQPPSVAKKADINALPATTRSVHARSLRDTDITALGRLRELTFLNFTSGFARNDVTTGFKKWEAAITDEGLSKLADLKLPKLDTLHLGYCEHITNDGLIHVSTMDSITWLSLQGSPQITDEGLKHLVAMKNLTGLDLRHCYGITDRRLKELEGKASWQLILLGGCPNVTAQGIAKLKAALPNARIDLRPE